MQKDSYDEFLANFVLILKSSELLNFAQITGQVNFESIQLKQNPNTHAILKNLSEELHYN